MKTPDTCCQGERCARHPWRTLGLAALAVALCAAGCARLRVETDPQRLWVGPGSQAAQEKADYEARTPLASSMETVDVSAGPWDTERLYNNRLICGFYGIWFRV